MPWLINDNWRKAVNYFKETGEWFEGCVLHHKDVNMKVNDPVRYAQWNPDDLCVMSRSEHLSLHARLRVENNDPNVKKFSDAGHQAHVGKPSWNKGLTAETDVRIKKHTDESRAKMSKAHKENDKYEYHLGFKGKKHTEETKKQMSASMRGKPHSSKGRHWKLVDGIRVWYD